MKPIMFENGGRVAVVSLWRSGDSVRYVVAGRNGGRRRILKTLHGAIKSAKQYCNL